MSNSGRTTRLFADVYDSAKQGRNVTWDDPVGRESYLARLRFDAFMYKKVVVTDVDILVGTFFLDAAASSLLDALPLERIEIKTRAPSLGDALLGWVRDPDGATLNPCFFPGLPSKLATTVQRALEEYPSTGVDHWRKIPAVLKDIGMDRGLADRYEATWAAWIERAKQDRLTLSQWSPFPFSERFDQLLAEDQSSTKAALKTPLGDGIMQKVWDDKINRRDLYGLEARARSENQNLTVSEQADLETILDWYNSAYNRTRAASHGAAPELTYNPNTRPFNENLVLLDQISRGSIQPSQEFLSLIEIPPSFNNALVKLEAKQFEAVLEEPRLASFLDEWHENYKIQDLERAANELFNVVHKLVGVDDVGVLSTTVLPTIRLIAEKFNMESGGKVGKALGALVEPFIAPKIGEAVGTLAGGTIGVVAKTAIPVLQHVVEERKRDQIVKSIIEVANDRHHINHD